MNKKVLFVTLLALLFEMQCRSRQPYNLILISIDTLRADHLGCYGYSKNTSPTIDSVAKDGVLFATTMAQRGQTWPSLTSILTSMYPQTHGVRENGDQLDASKITLPEILKSHGYTTAAALTNMQTAPNRGFDAMLMESGPLQA